MLHSTFLPSGYPHSVGEGYTEFTIYSAMAMWGITIMSFLSTQALFIALGSTMTQASVVSAAFIWVIKDGLGQFGGILFAAMFGKNFDEDIKKWRFLSGVAFIVSIYIEILTL